ncbi:TonB-dependent receptor [Aurantiacibacter sediminis]|uniref:TonB-dependent receptor n=1 Tax=Aurantiacibacter sediminis TaxID=2793064 RepID=A0ABS0N1C5_9SPHN|nr:TonB-dependent receptor [Aurantiacibacter sediminis]MBH5321771.1 TonB-dependent receptor [Aurantiacibacter sediminis]
MRKSIISPAGRVRSLATVSSLALVAAVPNVALAQDAPADEDPEEEVADENVIIVSGIRASLQSAQDFKEDADTVVDVITAEDIGALADRSVAEALQRVPGVNIDRFIGNDDPDRFSVEGSGVIIRGLPFVQANLNGRDVFSANGGRGLDFNNVSPELLGRVEVFKNVTADMIDGGISGTVNLVTRKPLDNPGLNIAGTFEYNYGDLAQEWSPGFSVLASNTFDTGIGTFGLQLGYAQQELITRSDASQITDPCYRNADFSGGCIRVAPASSAGIGEQQFDETNFPPEGAVIIPKGAGVRTSDFERDRRAYSVVAQYETADRRMLITAEYLRAETDGSLREFSALALVNDDGLFPGFRDGTTPVFDGNAFQSGILTQNNPFGGINGIPTELLRLDQEDEDLVEDYSLQIFMEPTDRLRFNFEGQYINNARSLDGFIAAMQTYSDLSIDNSGETPQVVFLSPGDATSDPSYFTDPARTFYWFALDNQAENDGEMYSLRGDVEYDISDTGFFRSARFGARWSERDRTTRNANFSNWGNLGAPWTGRGGNWNCGDFQAFGCGGAYVFDFPESANLYTPFEGDFQRGNAPTPFGNGTAFYFGGDDVLQRYLDGSLEEQTDAITAFTLTPNAWNPIYSRSNLVPGTPFTPAEISSIDEETRAAYARLDFGLDFDSGAEFSGNVGVRYVETTVGVRGDIAFPGADALGLPLGTVVTVAGLRDVCANAPAGTPGLDYCLLSDARLAEFAQAFTGESLADGSDVVYDNWLPAANLRFDTGTGFVFRGAVSRGLFRPDLAAFQTGGTLGNNTGVLREAGTLESGPLFAIQSGNRFLQPTRSWNYDLSAEWYFDDVGSLTAAFFMKDIEGIVSGGAEIRNYTTPSGATAEVLYSGPFNREGGTLKGVEVAYQQTYDFLPGALGGLGFQGTYTYVDAGSFNNTNLAGASPIAPSLPLEGVSEHTVNAVLFYEMYGISARAAYNWRSDFLITPRDVIFPFSPIYGESTGQLDASIFYELTDNIKIGVQGVNLLDEVTQTSQVIDFDGTRITRSAFRNDRRYTFLVRFNF